MFWVFFLLFGVSSPWCIFDVFDVFELFAKKKLFLGWIVFFMLVFKRIRRFQGIFSKELFYVLGQNSPTRPTLLISETFLKQYVFLAVLCFLARNMLHMKALLP